MARTLAAVGRRPDPARPVSAGGEDGGGRRAARQPSRPRRRSAVRCRGAVPASCPAAPPAAARTGRSTSRLVEAVVLVARRGGCWRSSGPFARDFPAIPLIAWGAFRPDDGELLAAWQREGVALVLVDGVDDCGRGRPGPARLAHRTAAGAPGRCAAGAPADRIRSSTRPGSCCSTGPTTRHAPPSWRRRSAVSREHLEPAVRRRRCPQPQAGDRPDPGGRWPRSCSPTRDWTWRAVVRILDFASPSHLERTVRRITGLRARDLGGLGVRGVLGAFRPGQDAQSAGVESGLLRRP